LREANFLRLLLFLAPTFISEWGLGGIFMSADMIRLACASGSGERGMCDPNDLWPEPNYDPGPHKHLHALGVISNNYNAFESDIFGFFRHYLELKGITRKTTEFLYGEMNERQRLNAIRFIIDEYETDQSAHAAISKLITYFEWCIEIRNTLLHAEQSGFGHTEILWMQKRSSKEYSKLNYLKLRIEKLRQIADQIKIGHDAGWDLFVYLFKRDTPPEKWPLTFRALHVTTLPEIPLPPKKLDLSEHGPLGPIPDYLRKS
jgi:hypothetical protein